MAKDRIQGKVFVYWQQPLRHLLPSSGGVTVSSPTKINDQFVFPSAEAWQYYSAYTEAPYSQWYVPTAPTKVFSQRHDILPDVWQQWEAYSSTQTIPLTPSSPTKANSQRIDILPDIWQQWESYTQVPYSQWYIPALPTKVYSQRADSLPDLNDLWWRQYKTQTQYTSLPVALLSHANPQRVDVAPDPWQEWEAYHQSPYVQWFVPLAPPLGGFRDSFTLMLGWWSSPRDSPTTRSSLTSYPYSDLWDWGVYYQSPYGRSFRPTVPSGGFRDSYTLMFGWWSSPRDSPPLHGNSQRFDSLSDPWQQWEAYHQSPYIQWSVPPAPPSTHQSSQRFNALLDFNDLWWHQHYVWPVPSGRAFAPVVCIIGVAGVTNLDLVWTGITNLGIAWTGVSG